MIHLPHGSDRGGIRTGWSRRAGRCSAMSPRGAHPGAASNAQDPADGQRGVPDRFRPPLDHAGTNNQGQSGPDPVPGSSASWPRICHGAGGGIPGPGMHAFLTEGPVAERRKAMPTETVPAHRLLPKPDKCSVSVVAGHQPRSPCRGDASADKDTSRSLRGGRYQKQMSAHHVHPAGSISATHF